MGGKRGIRLGMWQSGRQASKQTPQRAKLAIWGNGMGPVRYGSSGKRKWAASHGINENPSFPIPQVLQRAHV